MDVRKHCHVGLPVGLTAEAECGSWGVAPPAVHRATVHPQYHIHTKPKNGCSGPHLLPQHSGSGGRWIRIQGHLQLHSKSEASLGQRKYLTHTPPRPQHTHTKLNAMWIPLVLLSS